MDGYAFFVVGYELDRISEIVICDYTVQNMNLIICLYNQDGLWGMDREQQRHLQQR